MKPPMWSKEGTIELGDTWEASLHLKACASTVSIGVVGDDSAYLNPVEARLIAQALTEAADMIEARGRSASIEPSGNSGQLPLTPPAECG